MSAPIRVFSGLKAFLLAIFFAGGQMLPAWADREMNLVPADTFMPENPGMMILKKWPPDTLAWNHARAVIAALARFYQQYPHEAKGMVDQVLNGHAPANDESRRGLPFYDARTDLLNQVPTAAALELAESRLSAQWSRSWLLNQHRWGRLRLSLNLWQKLLQKLHDSEIPEALSILVEKPDAALAEQLLPWLRHAQPDIRAGTLLAIGQSGRTDLLPAIVPLLCDSAQTEPPPGLASSENYHYYFAHEPSQISVASAARAALSQIKIEDDLLYNWISLTSSDPALRAESVYSVNLLDYRHTPLVENLLTDPDSRVRAAAKIIRQQLSPPTIRWAPYNPDNLNSRTTAEEVARLLKKTRDRQFRHPQEKSLRMSYLFDWLSSIGGPEQYSLIETFLDLPAGSRQARSTLIQLVEPKQTQAVWKMLQSDDFKQQFDAILLLFNTRIPAFQEELLGLLLEQKCNTPESSMLAAAAAASLAQNLLPEMIPKVKRALDSTNQQTAWHLRTILAVAVLDQL